MASDLSLLIKAERAGDTNAAGLMDQCLGGNGGLLMPVGMASVPTSAPAHRTSMDGFINFQGAGKKEQCLLLLCLILEALMDSLKTMNG